MLRSTSLRPCSHAASAPSQSLHHGLAAPARSHPPHLLPRLPLLAPTEDLSAQHQWHQRPSQRSCRPPQAAAVLEAVTAPPSYREASPEGSSSSSSSGTGTGTSSGTSGTSPSASNTTSGSGPGRDNNDEYHANVGKAIRTLREDLPQLFTKDLNYSIYREDVAAVAPDLPPVRGRPNYRKTHAVLRMLARVFFRRMDMDVQRLWQPQDGLLRVRWSAIGTPWVSFNGAPISDNDKPCFEFIATYRFDRRGMIYQHNLDTIIPPEPPAVLATAGAMLSGARIGNDHMTTVHSPHRGGGAPTSVHGSGTGEVA